MPESNHDRPSLRDLVVTAAVDVVERDGLDLRPESVSYARVFAFLEDKYSVVVTRGSVHERIWGSHDEFRREVLAEAVAYIPGDTTGDIDAVAGGHAIETITRSDLDAEGRIAEFSKRLGWLILQSSLHSRTFASFQSMKAIGSRFNDPAATEALGSAFEARTGEHLRLRRLAFPGLMGRLGVRLRPKLGLTNDQASDLLTACLATVSVGASLDYHAGNRAACEPLGSFLGAGVGADVAWVPATIGLKGLLNLLFEPAPPVRYSDLPPMVPDPMPPDVPVIEATPGGRRSRSELRRLVVSAGIDLLLRDGLDLKLESIGYVAVFAEVKKSNGLVVNRASVHHRYWASHRDFCIEVLTNLVRRTATQAEKEPGPMPAPVLADDGSIDRLASVHDRIRTMVASCVNARHTSEPDQRRLLIKAALAGQPETDGTKALEREIIIADRTLAERARWFVQNELMSVGFVVRPELGLSSEEAVEILTIFSTTIMQGQIFDRMSFGPATTEWELPRHDDPSRTESWTLAAVGVRSCFELLFEEE